MGARSRLNREAKGFNTASSFRSKRIEALCRTPVYFNSVCLNNTLRMRAMWTTPSRTPRIPLRKTTSDTGLLVQAAVRGLRSIYKPGFNIAKAGVHLLDLQDGSFEQGELALEEGVEDRSGLMKALDELNDRYSVGRYRSPVRGPVGFAADG